jgi:hypothetical protein
MDCHVDSKKDSSGRFKAMKLKVLFTLFVYVLLSQTVQAQTILFPPPPGKGEPLTVIDIVAIAASATAFICFILCGKDIIFGDWDKALLFTKLK